MSITNKFSSGKFQLKFFAFLSCAVVIRHWVLINLFPFLRCLGSVAVACLTLNRLRNNEIYLEKVPVALTISMYRLLAFPTVIYCHGLCESLASSSSVPLPKTVGFSFKTQSCKPGGKVNLLET